MPLVALLSVALASNAHHTPPPTHRSPHAPGPEITEATVGALNTLTKHTDWKIDFTESLIGGAALDATDNKEAFPDLSLEQCRASDSILLACIGGYKWDNNPREARPETGLLKMRSKMGLFANLRPAKVRSDAKDVAKRQQHQNEV